MKEYCYVFDYTVCAIYEIELTKGESNDSEVEDILDRRGLKIDQCEVMFSDKKLEVESINLKDDESV